MTHPQSVELIAQARRLAREALSTERGVDPHYPLSACDRAIELLEPLGPNDVLADVLRWKGTILRDSGDHRKAQDLYAQSLAVADATSYTLGRAHALNCFGTIAQLRGELDSASSWYRSARTIADGLRDRRLSGMIEQNLAITAATAGRPVEALNHFLVALEAFEAERNEQASLWVLNNLGNLYTRQGSYELAADALRRAQALAEKLSDVATEGIVEENRARLFLATGKLEEAEDAATRALGIAAQRHDGPRQAAAVTTIARAKRRKDPTMPEIRALLEIALQLTDNGADAELRTEILRDISEVYQESGEVEKATTCRDAASALAGLRPERPPARADWLEI
jgi:tetratricopeptide (TPR) repeat protein